MRRKTLWLLDQVPDDLWNVRVHDFYSPIGWHFGHIGMTEEYWTCAQALGSPPLDERSRFLFANIPENPKDNRVHLPSRDEIARLPRRNPRARSDALGGRTSRIATIRCLRMATPGSSPSSTSASIRRRSPSCCS